MLKSVFWLFGKSFSSSKLSFVCLPPINSKYTNANNLASFKAPWISLSETSMLYLLHKESKLTDWPLNLFLAKVIVSIIRSSFITGKLHTLNSSFINPISNEELWITILLSSKNSINSSAISSNFGLSDKNSVVRPWTFNASKLESLSGFI